MRPTLISLFAGAGGLDIGLERSGWDTVTATDLDPAAVASLQQSKAAKIPIPNRPGHTYLQSAHCFAANVCDLKAADLRLKGATTDWRPSLLAGGPPCQPWSSAGLQKGFKDPRGVLIAQMIRLTDELKPRYVLMENVRGLLTAAGPRGHHGEAIEMIQKEWENLGYAVRWSLVNAADYGVPQRRIRMVMIATADHELPPFPEPTHNEEGIYGRKPWVSLREFLSSQPAPDATDVVTPSGVRVEQLQALKPGTGIKTGGVVEHQRPGGHWGYRQDSFLADLSRPSRTIRAAGTPDWIRLDDGNMRRLTWRECAALQGFPSEWVFDEKKDARFRLIGNAVQTNVAESIGCVLLSALSRGKLSITPSSPEWPPYFRRRISGASADHRANAATRKRRVVELDAPLLQWRREPEDSAVKKVDSRVVE